MKPEDSSVIKLGSPTKLKLYVGALIPKVKTIVSQTALQKNTKITNKKKIIQPDKKECEDVTSSELNDKLPLEGY